MFEADFKSMNYMQIADWLIACRNTKRQENYDSYKDYVSELACFCDEWEEFYRQHNEQYGNNSVFKSVKFKKALLYIEYKDRYHFHIDFKEFKEAIPVDTYENILQSQFEKTILDEINHAFDSIFEAVQDIIKSEDGFKVRLHEVISTRCFNHVHFTIRVFNDDGKQLRASSYKEAIKLCEEVKNYTIQTKEKQKKVGFYQVFNEYDISTTVYTEYLNPSTCEQEFNKKTFVNLAFLLCYNATDAEKFLKFNGYSIKNQTRQFDIICEKALRIGFGREIAIALIDKYNMELQERFSGCKVIANLTKNRKNKLSADNR